tara:strand:- start:386066 stop:387595 length:1530 start_codon:yes stop_codon:yes gene_type:complete
MMTPMLDRIHLSVPLCLALLCFAGDVADAQTMVSPALQKASRQAKPETPPQVVFRVHAAAEPEPALVHRFWPSPELRRQANPMPFVSRAILLAAKSSYDRDEAIEISEQFSRWQDLSIEKLPLGEVHRFVEKYASGPLGELARAENMMDLQYDLQFEQLTATEVIATVLPEVQEMRGLARLLVIRARLAVAEHRWDDFEQDIRLGMRLAEIAGHSTDFLVNRLVGYAIAESLFEVVEEAMQQPGCPNLYWALASIPVDDLFETRQSLEFESVFTTKLCYGLDPLPDAVIGAEAARVRILRLVHEVNAVQQPEPGPDTLVKAKLLAGIYVASMEQPSRQLLAETTQWSGRVDELSAPEAVLRATVLRFAQSRDKWFKWSLLPKTVAAPYADRIEADLQATGEENDIILSILGNLFPAVSAVHQANSRLHQKHGYLCTIEAIRMHAAIAGEFPDSLDRIEPVPAWPDPVSKSDFFYHRQAPTRAMLTRGPRYRTGDETPVQLALTSRGDKR